jgi:hypothetical protein
MHTPKEDSFAVLCAALLMYATVKPCISAAVASHVVD